MASAHRPPPPTVARPPTAHTLKPHHIHILNIFLTISKYPAELPSTYLLHVYRLMIYEVSETRQPASFEEIMTKLRMDPQANDSVVQHALADIENSPRLMATPDTLTMFFHALPKIFVDREEEEGSRFARRSLFGYFVRRCYVSFVKLSFDAVNALWHQYHLWVLGRLNENAYDVRRDLLDNSFHIYKTDADKKEYARPEDYGWWEAGLATGDEILATEHLRKFFEQHFHDLNDSGLRQHALLNLARMHYLRHEYTACRKLLQEAITTARTNNDRQTLQHCTGLMNRLPVMERGRRPLINDIQADLHPYEILHDVKKLLTVTYQQPIGASFERIAQAEGLYDAWTEAGSTAVSDTEQYGLHAVQSVAWVMMGNTQLAEVEEIFVMTMSDPGSDDNTRITTILNRSYRRARQGDYQDAIAELLEPAVWSGLTVGDCQVWAGEIWHILALRASRRGQVRMFHDFLLPRRPPSAYNSREYWFSFSQPLGSLIRDPLFEVLAAREVKQAHNSVQPLLNSLWHAEFQQRFGLYRTALVMLADVGLEYGMTKWSRRMIEEIMPQVINGDDKEQRGFACFTLARCIIAAEDSKPEALRECIPYLEIAERDYAALEMFRCQQDVLFLLSVLYHNLGMTEERDKIALRHQEVGKQREEAEKVVSEPWIAEVLDVVSEVSAMLAAR